MNSFPCEPFPLEQPYRVILTSNSSMVLLSTFPVKTRVQSIWNVENITPKRILALDQLQLLLKPLVIVLRSFLCDNASKPCHFLLFE